MSELRDGRYKGQPEIKIYIDEFTIEFRDAMTQAYDSYAITYNDAIRTAQAILDSTADIRPELAGRRVIAVCHVREPMTVAVGLDNGEEIHYTGLFAKVILAKLNHVN